MGVAEDLQAMSQRLAKGEGHRISKRIELYSVGVSAKFRNAEFALGMLQQLASQADSASTSETAEFGTTDKLHFYLDSYFAFLYSTFDVISQVVNQKLRLGIDERQVSFKRVTSDLAKKKAGTKVEKTYQSISQSKFFKNLERYRNCSTHRRQIYIKEMTVKISETAGYSSTGDIVTVRRVICDDPLTLKPSVKQDREIITYTSKVLERAKEEISKIAKSL